MRSNWNLIHSWLIRLPFFLNVSFFLRKVTSSWVTIFPATHCESMDNTWNPKWPTRMKKTLLQRQILSLPSTKWPEIWSTVRKINLISSLRIFSPIETRYSYLFIVHSTYKRAPTCHADLLTCAIAQRDTTSVKCW